jgi:hypothetical protein
LANALDRKEVSDGMIDGPRWSTGRWPGKEALCFDNHNDFVEFEIPGEHSELSVAAWIKVDRFEHEMSAILNSDGDAFGGLHFQMNRLGLPRGGMLGVGRPAQRWVGNPVPKGKWVHIVSVLSLEQRSHVIYVNAQPVLQTELASTNLKIRPGRCRLGNWQEPSRSPDHSPLLTRPLSGVVDELSIWNRALSAAEIAALTERGRPSLLWTRENPPLKVPMPRL